MTQHPQFKGPSKWRKASHSLPTVNLNEQHPFKNTRQRVGNDELHHMDGYWMRPEHVYSWMIIAHAQPRAQPTLMRHVKRLHGGTLLVPCYSAWTG